MVRPNTLKLLRPVPPALNGFELEDLKQQDGLGVPVGVLFNGSMDKQSHPILKARTILAQALGAGDATTRALVPPVHMSATFLRDADNGYESGYVYGRTDNATVKQVEAILAHLEGAARRAACSARGWPRRPRSSSRSNDRRTSSRRDGHVLGLSRVAGRHRSLRPHGDVRRHHRPRRGRRGGPPRRDRPVLDRDAEQSAVDDHRHRGHLPRSRMRPARCCASTRRCRRRC